MSSKQPPARLSSGDREEQTDNVLAALSRPQPEQQEEEDGLDDTRKRERDNDDDHRRIRARKSSARQGDLQMLHLNNHMLRMQTAAMAPQWMQMMMMMNNHQQPPFPHDGTPPSTIFARQQPPVWPPGGQSAMPTRPVPKGIPLALGCDEEQLTEFQILIRHQLEIFEAGPEDVENNTQGRKKHIKVGQVGLRCKHCSSLPIRARGRGAVYYPSKLKHVYQAAQNMAVSHLIVACRHLPPDVREQLKALRDRRDNASGGKKYWADGCRVLGVVEEEEGLFLNKTSEENPSL